MTGGGQESSGARRGAPPPLLILWCLPAAVTILSCAEADEWAVCPLCSVLCSYWLLIIEHCHMTTHRNT